MQRLAECSIVCVVTPCAVTYSPGLWTIPLYEQKLRVSTDGACLLLLAEFTEGVLRHDEAFDDPLITGSARSDSLRFFVAASFKDGFPHADGPLDEFLCIAAAGLRQRRAAFSLPRTPAPHEANPGWIVQRIPAFWKSQAVDPDLRGRPIARRFRGAARQ